jgi:hypothetical protein
MAVEVKGNNMACARGGNVGAWLFRISVDDGALAKN